MGDCITIQADFYFEYEKGQVNAKLPGILGAVGINEDHAAEMLETFFEFLLKRWQNNGVLNKMLTEHQFVFENNLWKRTLEHGNGTISIQISLD